MELERTGGHNYEAGRRDLRSGGDGSENIRRRKREGERDKEKQREKMKWKKK